MNECSIAGNNSYNYNELFGAGVTKAVFIRRCFMTFDGNL